MKGIKITPPSGKTPGHQKKPIPSSDIWPGKAVDKGPGKPQNHSK